MTLSLLNSLSNLALTLYWKVQKICCLLHWKANLIIFPTIYSMHHETHEDGTILNEKWHQYHS
jgi:hypothetical protein